MQRPDIQKVDVPGPRHVGTQERAQRFVPIVRHMAKGLKSRLPSSVDLDDLVQSGLLGLFQAAERFSGPSESFENFARLRIRGAMLDNLRTADSAPRSLRRTIRRLRGITQKLEQTLCRAPTAREIAAAAGMPLAAYQHLVHVHHLHLPIYADDHERAYDRELFSDASADPLQKALQTSAQISMQQALAKLSTRERSMLRLHFEDGIKLRAIGSLFGVTQSRVSQILTKATARLRARLP